MIIPNYFKEYANDLTLIRIEENKKRYNGTHRERKGPMNSVLLGQVDREYYTEYIGILAEIIIRDYCDRDVDCSDYNVSTFIKERTLVTHDQDITIKKKGELKRISIKACENSLKANKYAIDNEDVDLVVFVLFKSTSDYAFYSFTPDEIKEWYVNEWFTDYYELKVI